MQSQFEFLAKKYAFWMLKNVGQTEWLARREEWNVETGSFPEVLKFLSHQRNLISESRQSQDGLFVRLHLQEQFIFSDHARKLFLVSPQQADLGVADRHCAISGREVMRLACSCL